VKKSNFLWILCAFFLASTFAFTTIQNAIAAGFEVPNNNFGNPAGCSENAPTSVEDMFGTPDLNWVSPGSGKIEKSITFGTHTKAKW